MRRILAAAAAVSLLATAAAGQTADEAEAALEEQTTAFEQAYNSGDTAALAELYTEDAVILPPNAARAQGRDAIAGFWGGAMEQGLKDLDLTSTEIEAMDGTAVEIGTFTATAPAAEGGGETEIAGKFLVVWKRGDDGAWRLHRDIWNMGQ